MFIFELEDLEVIEISCTFASRNKNLTNMPRSTRKKSKTGFYHVMLRVNTEPSPVHSNVNKHSMLRQKREKSKTGICHVMQGKESKTCPSDSHMNREPSPVHWEPSPVHFHFIFYASGFMKCKQINTCVYASVTLYIFDLPSFSFY